MNTSLKKPLVYVTRDIERALGMEPLGDYFIAANKTPYAESIAARYPDNVLLVGSKEVLDTYELLSHTDVAGMIARLGAEVIVFQNTSRIERLAREKGWRLLNPPAELARTVEEKISQVRWLEDDESLLPPHEIRKVKEVSFDGTRFVLQFNHSHTGEGTYIIDAQAKLDELVEKFPERECRITDYIDGPAYTANATVSGDRTLVGNISFQITGLPPFTDRPFSTVGNDWALPKELLSEKEAGEIRSIAEK
ncbi:MAG: hypothetical protein WC767_03565, partial [Candidatus Paceibacterota bacterium]